jgi:5-methylcytosine-specific restriction enzyme A
MARSPHVCAAPGCPNLADPGQSYCGDCGPRLRRASQRRHDASRPSPAARGYGADWRKRRARFLAAHPACADCGAPATVADHDPVSRRDLVAAGAPDPDADRHLKARCKPCHDRRTASQDGGFGNPRGRTPPHPGPGTVGGCESPPVRVPSSGSGSGQGVG